MTGLWTEHEDAVLRALHTPGKRFPWRRAALRLPGRTKGGMRVRMQRLGLLGPRGACVKGVPWTKREVATLRRLYRARKGRTDWTALLTALPGRTKGAIINRLFQIRRAERPRDLVGQSRWTRAETETLTRERGLVGRRSLREKLPGRSWRAILSHARHLGLATFPQGWCSRSEAARRAGYHPATLDGILAWANAAEMARRARGGTPGDADDVGVPTRLHTTTQHGRDNAKVRWLLVEWEACERAVERWVRSETCRDAAQRLGVPRHALARWLVDAGEAPAPKGRVGRRMFRALPEVYDRVVAAQRDRPTLAPPARALPRTLARAA